MQYYITKYNRYIGSFLPGSNPAKNLMYDNSFVQNNIEYIKVCSLFRKEGVPGQAYGPFRDQAPLNFNINDSGFLKDLSDVDPSRYNQMLDSFIIRNYNRIFGTDYNSAYGIDRETRKVGKLFAWLLTFRCIVSGFNKTYISGEFFMAPMTTFEYDMIMKQRIAEQNEWNAKESKWVQFMTASSYGSLDAKRVLNDYYNPETRNNVKISYIYLWEEIKEENNVQQLQFVQ